MIYNHLSNTWDTYTLCMLHEFFVNYLLLSKLLRKQFDKIAILLTFNKCNFIQQRWFQYWRSCKKNKAIKRGLWRKNEKRKATNSMLPNHKVDCFMSSPHRVESKTFRGKRRESTRGESIFPYRSSSASQPRPSICIF